MGKKTPRNAVEAIVLRLEEKFEEYREASNDAKERNDHQTKAYYDRRSDVYGEVMSIIVSAVVEWHGLRNWH